MPELIFRAADASDVHQLLGLVQDAPRAAHWSEAIWQQVLASAAETGQRVVLVAEHEGRAIGFGVMGLAGDAAEIESLGVGAGWRRQQVGRRLCEQMFDWARSQGARRLFLEVRVSNSTARAFYRSLGFTEDGVRRRYYRNPEEDAVLMARSL